MQGMHQDGSDARDRSGLNCSQYGVPHQCLANALSLGALIDCQTAKNHDRHGIWHISLDIAWREFMGHAANCQGVKADNPVPLTDSIGTAGFPFILQRLGA